jgi:hypothetical protein
VTLSEPVVSFLPLTPVHSIHDQIPCSLSFPSRASPV